jgi:hypothetical protein
VEVPRANDSLDFQRQRIEVYSAWRTLSFWRPSQTMAGTRALLAALTSLRDARRQATSKWRVTRSSVIPCHQTVSFRCTGTTMGASAPKAYELLRLIWRRNRRMRIGLPKAHFKVESVLSFEVGQIRAPKRAKSRFSRAFGAIGAVASAPLWLGALSVLIIASDSTCRRLGSANGDAVFIKNE